MSDVPARDLIWAVPHTLKFSCLRIAWPWRVLTLLPQVTFNAIDLPETVNIVKEHLKKKDAPPDDSSRSFWQSKYGQLK